jgi:hypothetical protein
MEAIEKIERKRNRNYDHHQDQLIIHSRPAYTAPQNCRN